MQIGSVFPLFLYYLVVWGRKHPAYCKELEKHGEISSGKGRECRICLGTAVFLAQFCFGVRKGINTQLRKTQINTWNIFKEEFVVRVHV